MRRLVPQILLLCLFLVPAARAQWTPANATSTDPIAHANDITVSGNVGINNATLKPWTSGKVVQGTTGAFFLGTNGDIHMISNAYTTGGATGWNYMNSGNAANLYLFNGELIVRTAQSGTADTALTWTSYPLQVKNSGSVLIGMSTGATSSYALDVNGPQHIAGNVAIGGGTALPPQRLTVYGGHIAIDNGAQLLGRDASNAFHFRLIGNDSANRIALGDNTTSIANEIRFHTNGGAVPTMVVNTAGNVGIGTAAPAHRLHVSGGFIAMDNSGQLLGGNPGNGFYYRLIGNDSANRIALGDSSSSVANEIRFHTNASATPTMVINTSGNVGIGLTVASQKLSVAGWIESTSGGIKFPDGSLQSTAFSSNGSASVANTSATGAATIAAIAGDGTNTSNIAYLRVATNETTPKDWRIGMIDGTAAFKIRDNAANTDRMTISGSSITFNGNVTGTTILATYQDLAEWVPASETLTAGTVVVVGETADNTVTASMHAYDTGVAGVVSANPGLLLGVASASKAKIATTGRVRVRVDATRSPIRKGDLLVTSDRPGMAMRSEPLDLGGVKIHRPGTLIGKALEPLAGGEGEILVLLSLQ